MTVNGWRVPFLGDEKGLELVMLDAQLSMNKNH